MTMSLFWKSLVIWVIMGLGLAIAPLISYMRRDRSRDSTERQRRSGGW